MGESLNETSRGESALAEGVVVAGKYRLGGELGVGAMGVVRSATHTTLGHQVAIKFLLKSVMASDHARNRFEREAKLAARLGEASRHITRVIDHGVTEERVPYLVMEQLRGESLSARLKRERRLPLVLATRIVQQLARALHVAHSAGIVHRDLKPANVFLCTPEQGDEVEVKLLDFGIAKASFDGEEEHPTSQGQVLGTPSYMSPEQILSERPVDARSDLWAVAAMVYRMVVGRPPFGGGMVQELAVRITSTEAYPPSQVCPDLPVQLDMWMARGLAKNPDERFQSARELADFLSSVAGVNATGAGSTRRVSSAGPEDTGPSHSSTNGSQIHAARPVGRRRSPWPIAFASIAVSVFVVFAFMRASPKASTAAAAIVSASALVSAPPPAPSLSSAPIESASAEPSIHAAASASVRPPKTKKEGSGWDNKHEL